MNPTTPLRAEPLLEQRLLFDLTPKRVVLGIDPGDSTGIAVWSVEPEDAPLRFDVVKIDRAGWTQEQAIALIDDFIGSASWLAAIERPPPPKRGPREAPSHAERYWRDVVDLVARRRCVRAASRYSKPLVLRPRPDEWRGPLGIRTRGLGGDAHQRRESLKQAAIARLKLVHGIEVEAPDAAEALQVAEWAARACKLTRIPMRGSKPVEVWWAI